MSSVTFNPVQFAEQINEYGTYGKHDIGKMAEIAVQQGFTLSYNSENRTFKIIGSANHSIPNLIELFKGAVYWHYHPQVFSKEGESDKFFKLFVPRGIFSDSSDSDSDDSDSFEWHPISNPNPLGAGFNRLLSDG